MPKLGFRLIVKLGILEFKRNFQVQTRKLWSLFYSFFIQIIFLLIIYSSFGIGNFLSNEEHTRLLLSIFFTLQVFSLPAFHIIISYDNFIQDPILETLIIASQTKTNVLFSKLLGTNTFVYLVFIINHIIGTMILLMLFQDFSILRISFYVGASFIIIILFIGVVTSTFLLYVRLKSTDKVSTIILPITIFYIIPFLLVNSLSYQVFNPIIADLSPTVWMLEFVTKFAFENQIGLRLLFLPLISVGLLMISNYIFENLEIRHLAQPLESRSYSFHHSIQYL